MKPEDKAYENRSCPNGEVNSITKEYFCNSHKQFCIDKSDCIVKVFQKALNI